MLLAEERQRQRQRLWSLLGRLPNGSKAVSSRVILQQHHPAGYEIQRLELDLNAIEPVPAYFIKPADRSGDRLPAVLYHHSHGGDYTIGKEELFIGREYLPPGYAAALTQAGYAVLVIDCWNFGERYRRTESSLFKEMLWRGQVLWGMMVYDAVRALDYLVTREDVDPSRIATMGMSMGSTMSWWLAALDERVRVCADICCLTDFDALIETGALDEHGPYYYVPDLLTHFTTSQINELICPRPHLSLAGTLDPLTPVAGLERIDRDLQRAYSEANAPQAWKLFRQPVAHTETPEMRSEVLAWLKRWL